MDAFFSITLSILVLRYWWKHRERTVRRPPKQEPIKFAAFDDKVVAAREKARSQRERDEEELRKQGYSDELIATILPVINNGG